MTDGHRDCDCTASLSSLPQLPFRNERARKHCTVDVDRVDLVRDGRHGGRRRGEEGEKPAAAPQQATREHGLAAFARPSLRFGDRDGAWETSADRAHDAAAGTTNTINRT